MMMMMNNKSCLIAAVTLCSMMSMAQLIIENPADADQTPRFIRSSSIEAHHQQHTLPRFLQTSVGNLPDIVADGNMCWTYGGLEFQCDIYQRVGPEDDSMDLNITIRCELGIVQFDFRRASGCHCIAQLTPKNTSRIAKFCPCFVCPIGFGSSSFSLDCTEYTEVYNETRQTDDEVSSGFFEGTLGDTTASPYDPYIYQSASPYDPYIFSTCVTLDCSAACNGTCALGCGAGAGPTCAFCENNENAPTPAPTGMDGEVIERIGGNNAPTPAPNGMVGEVIGRIFGSGAAGACLEQTKMAAASVLLFMMVAVML